MSSDDYPALSAREIEERDFGHLVPGTLPHDTNIDESNLADFLLARIAEDEAMLPEWFVGTAAEWMPIERIKAECESKRNVVRIVRNLADRGGIVTARTVPHILRHLALPYTDHPDYREEWRP